MNIVIKVLVFILIVSCITVGAFNVLFLTDNTPPTLMGIISKLASFDEFGVFSQRTLKLVGKLVTSFEEHVKLSNALNEVPVVGWFIVLFNAVLAFAVGLLVVVAGFMLDVLAFFFKVIDILAYLLFGEMEFEGIGSIFQ